MKVLVCGDRHWSDTSAILSRLSQLPSDTVIIEGEANGADKLAAGAAEYLGFQVLRFPAKWEEHGPSAGFIRNEQMLREGKPELVIAFHSNLLRSKGTRHMVELARKHGVPVEVIGNCCRGAATACRRYAP